jgi:hypothetical protein
MRKGSIAVLTLLLALGFQTLPASAGDSSGMQAQGICDDGAVQDRIKLASANVSRSPSQETVEAMIAADLSSANTYEACAGRWIDTYPVYAAFCYVYAATYEFWAAREEHIIHEDYTTSLGDAYDDARVAGIQLDGARAPAGAVETQRQGLQTLMDELNSAQGTWGGSVSSAP